jgi:uncharacterized metal-binding protein
MKKTKTQKCSCEPAEVLIFPCSGGSNVGQIANNAAKDLTALGTGDMYCLAGIGGKVSNLILTTKLAKKIVAIDGCPVHCAKKTLKHAGIDVNVHVVVTDLKIEKRNDFYMDIDEINKVVEKVSAQLRHKNNCQGW